MPVILGKHPVGQLLKKAAVGNLGALGLAVFPAAQEYIAFGHVPAGEISGQHRVCGGILNGEFSHRFRGKPGDTECGPVLGLLFCDERAGLEPLPHSSDRSFFTHKCPIPPQKLVTALAP